jgi:subtilisin family serine protease
LLLEMVKLTELMARTSGRPDVMIGLVDGPVVTRHPDMAGEHVRKIPGGHRATCTEANSIGCLHGTFVAGILSAKRHTSAPAICPGCTLLVRPIFADQTIGGDQMPHATPGELAGAILDCVHADAQIINLSLAYARPSIMEERSLEAALNYAAKRRVIVVAAAGNQGTLGSSALTRHPWVIPVAACDFRGRPLDQSNLGASVGRRGLIAPGDAITSLGAHGKAVTLGGTSVAAPFVTGAIALLWSIFPAATAALIKLAICRTAVRRRASIVPPLLDAETAYQSLLAATPRGMNHPS